MSVYILVLVTGVYYGEVASAVGTTFNDKGACDSAGARWVLEAKAINVRMPRYICLPKYQ